MVRGFLLLNHRLSFAEFTENQFLLFFFFSFVNTAPVLTYYLARLSCYFIPLEISVLFKRGNIYFWDVCLWGWVLLED